MTDISFRTPKGPNPQYYVGLLTFPQKKELALKANEFILNGTYPGKVDWNKFVDSLKPLLPIKAERVLERVKEEVAKSPYAEDFRGMASGIDQFFIANGIFVIGGMAPDKRFNFADYCIFKEDSFSCTTYLGRLPIWQAAAIYEKDHCSSFEHSSAGIYILNEKAMRKESEKELALGLLNKIHFGQILLKMLGQEATHIGNQNAFVEIASGQSLCAAQDKAYADAVSGVVAQFSSVKRARTLLKTTSLLQRYLDAYPEDNDANADIIGQSVLELAKDLKGIIQITKKFLGQDNLAMARLVLVKFLGDEEYFQAAHELKDFPSAASVKMQIVAAGMLFSGLADLGIENITQLIELTKEPAKLLNLLERCYDADFISEAERKARLDSKLG